MEKEERKEEGKEIKKEETNVKGGKFEKKLILVSRKKFIFLFFIGLLVGIAIKGGVMRKHIIGFEDYKIKQLRSDYDLNFSEPEVPSEQDETVDEPVQDEPVQEPLNCN